MPDRAFCGTHKSTASGENSPKLFTCWVVDIIADIRGHSKDEDVAELVGRRDAVVVQEARLCHEARHLSTKKLHANNSNHDFTGPFEVVLKYCTSMIADIIGERHTAASSLTALQLLIRSRCLTSFEPLDDRQVIVFASTCDVAIDKRTNVRR